MTFWDQCYECGKRTFRSGKDARRYAKRVPGTHMNAYPCPAGRGFHVGHLPDAVRRGELDKDDYLAAVRSRRCAGGAR